VNILSGVSVEELVTAIAEADLPRLTAIPGVGRKTGERVLVELKDKVLELRRADGYVAEPPPKTKRDRATEDVISALMNLGCARKEATAAAEEARKAMGADAEFEKLVKQALKGLAEGRGQG
jgi:Holliday junction DNA helicase RuvA